MPVCAESLQEYFRNVGSAKVLREGAHEGVNTTGRRWTASGGSTQGVGRPESVGSSGSDQRDRGAGGVIGASCKASPPEPRTGAKPEVWVPTFDRGDGWRLGQEYVERSTRRITARITRRAAHVSRPATLRSYRSNLISTSKTVRGLNYRHEWRRSSTR